jgi:hypothetical protein
MSINQEYKKLLKEFKSKKLIKFKSESPPAETDEPQKLQKGTYEIIERLSLNNVWYWLGKKKLTTLTSFNEEKKYIVKFIKDILTEERNQTNIDYKNKKLIYIYRRTLFNKFLKTFPLIFILPTYLYITVIKSKKLKFLKYFMLIPLIMILNPYKEMLNNYNLHLESFLMLYVIEKLYKDDNNLQKEYESFMKERNLKFVDRSSLLEYQ